METQKVLTQVLIPRDKKGIMLDICFDNSDIRSDYHDPHYRLESFLLAITSKKREDERLARSVINQIPQLKEIPFKWCTERYSMGHGNYLISTIYTEQRKHPYEDRQINCHYEITFRDGCGCEVTPHPHYLGEIDLNTQESVSEITIRENKEKNGIEILFPCKPPQETINLLKSYGFRWNLKQALWYKRNEPGLIENIQNALKTH